MKKRTEYTEGQVINTLTFVRDDGYYTSPCGSKHRGAIFRCYCGKEFRTRIITVTKKLTTSCGCFARAQKIKAATTHGKSKHFLFKKWIKIKERCYNPNAINYERYGARGIKMSEEFRDDFMSFFNYVTSLPNYENVKPLKLTLDRVDNDKGYQRGNLRWATASEQARNKRVRVDYSRKASRI